ncbi:LemA family protein [Noviherbaspirillum sp. ST9]|uniref:LemA family protein n=1 Tax=Noviherbaspirillum sp. ST9 TaxID=3401606 RepID=UPI003B58ADE9
MTGLIVLTVVALLILSWGVGAYKRLVGLQNQVKNTFSQVNGQLKRRYDLIPDLAEIAKGYLKHERETLEAVIAACNHARSANAKAAADPYDTVAMRGMAAAEEMLSATLDRMFALAEACSELKADKNMMQLSEELASTESRIAFTRQAYNDGAMQYNASRAQFPSSIIAVVFAFKRAGLLQSMAAQEERKRAKRTI